MFCTNCGKKIEDDSKFCEFCGAKVAEVPEQETPVQRESSRPKKKIAEEKPQRQSPPAQPAPKSGGGSKFWKTTLTAALIASGVFFLQGFLGGISMPEGQVENNKSKPLEAVEKLRDVPYRSYKVSKPRLEDFAWYGDIGVKKFFANGQRLEYHQCLGSWKAMAVYTQKDATFYGRATYYAQLEGRMADAVLALQGYRFYLENNTPVSEDNSKYTFAGGYDPALDNIVFRSKDFGIVAMGPFIEKDGKQYGFCKFKTKNDVVADLLLMRP